MPSLSERLKSLGVKVGASELPPPLPRPHKMQTLEEALAGSSYTTHQGETFLVEARYPLGHPHGRAGLQIDAPLQVLAKWAGDERIAGLTPPAFAFLDIETTGLSGGSGTYAFLIGAARFEGDEFHLAQFFMRDPIEEPAQLAAFEEFLAPCQAMVTFNGKAFDVPLLQARFTTQGWRSPFGELAHLDLLHLARRLWRERLPSRTLANLEVQILEAARSEEDVPGWMIPSLYFQYLRDGDPTPLKNIFYHNAMDVLSLAGLLNHMAGLLADPLEVGSQYGVDLIALAKLFEELGDLAAATRLYIHGLEHEDASSQRLPRATLLEAIQRLALIYKRQENFAEAVALWEQAAYHQHLHAHIELAKYYEHHARDYTEAIRWSQAAVDLVEDPLQASQTMPALSAYDRRQWLEELRRRLERLRIKADKVRPDIRRIKADRERSTIRQKVAEDVRRSDLNGSG